MNCKKCNAQLAPEDKVCKRCGTVVEIASSRTMQSTQNFQNNIGGDYTNSQQFAENQNMNYTNNTQTSNQNINYMNNNPSKTNPYQPTHISNNTQKKKNNKLIIVLLGCLGVILILVFVINFGTNSNGSNAVNNSNIDNSSVHKINFEDFVLNIPSNMTYKFSSNTLWLSDEVETWIVEIGIYNGNYNQAKNNYLNIQSYFQQKGLKAQPAEIKKLKGIEYVTFEFVKGKVNILGAYAKLNSAKIISIVTYNEKNRYDYSILEKMASIINTAQYNQPSSYMEAENFKFDMNEMLNFVQ